MSHDVALRRLNARGEGQTGPAGVLRRQLGDLIALGRYWECIVQPRTHWTHS